MKLKKSAKKSSV